MTSTKTELLERTRALWEAALSGDGADRPSVGVSNDSSRLDLYERVERVLPEDDDLAQLASWAFNQAVHRLAGEDGAPKSARALIRNVTLDLFDEMMMSNLCHASWAEEEFVWRDMPARLHDIN